MKTKVAELGWFGIASKWPTWARNSPTDAKIRRPNQDEERMTPFAREAKAL